jgi:hypothetical protein
MQTSPNPRGRLQKIKAALRGWFIKIGLEPPPDELYNKEKQLSEDEAKAQLDLRFHKLPRPPRSPGAF